MIVHTTRFGPLEIDPEAVLAAPRGLIGFPGATRFVLIDHAPETPFQWLQSLDDPSLAFVVTDPHLFFPGYDLEIPDGDAERLGIREPADARILTTITVRRAAGEVTTNLLGPLVIGVPCRRIAQLVLDGDRYSTRHALPLAASPMRERRENGRRHPAMQPAA
jgi:flagellar assembly factor FliW